MSENSGDKTEKPSQQKLRKTREQGQVARSRDLAMAVGVLLSFKLLVLMTPQYLDDFGRLFRLALAPADLDAEAGHALFVGTLWLSAKLVLPLLVLPLAALITGVVPGGLLFATSNWLPKMQRLSPAANLGRLASGKHWGDAGDVLSAAVGYANFVAMVTPDKGRPLRAQALELQARWGKPKAASAAPAAAPSASPQATPAAPEPTPEKAPKKKWWKLF